MRYRIAYRPAVEKQLAVLDSRMAERIEQAIGNLADTPRPYGCIKMQGKDSYRIRIGDYRIVYEIHDRIVTILVVAVGHRKDIYR